MSPALAEDASLAVAAATFGYSDAELAAMPVWLAGVRLGIVDGSDGYPKRAGKVTTKAEVEAINAAREKASGGRRGSRHGRLDPAKARPTFNAQGRPVDRGIVLRGDAAR